MITTGLLEDNALMGQNVTRRADMRLFPAAKLVTLAPFHAAVH